MRARYVLLVGLLGVAVFIWRMPNNRDTREHMASVFLTGELVRLAAAQAEYHAAHGRYSLLVDSSAPWRRSDILLRIDTADVDRWSATVTWPSIPISCRWRVDSPTSPVTTFEAVARECVLR